MISDYLDATTRTVKARGSVDNSARLLKAEMYVTVDLSLDSKPRLEVSSKAIFLKGNQHYVFVEQARGQYVRRPVTLANEDHDTVHIVEGLAAGQRVVTDGCLLLEALMQAGSKS